MKLTWVDHDNPDERDINGAVALLEASRRVDFPHRTVVTVAAHRAWLRHGWDGSGHSTALGRDDRGRVVGVLEVDMSEWDNTHIGRIDVTIDPSRRRQGLGRELYSVGLERVREAGRTLVLATCDENSPGGEFVRALGFEPAIEEIVRMQDLLDVDWAALDDAYHRAEPYAEGYELVRMPGEVPDDMVDAVLRMTTAINDAPTGELDVEDEVFTVERLRSFEEAERARNRRLYRVAARHVATGDLAGHTVIGVEAEQPGYSFQYDTSVLGEHRGHRLGLLLKIDMLRWLAEAEPQLRHVYTGNAASNAHMIGINELLGYRIVRRYVGYQLRL